MTRQNRDGGAGLDRRAALGLGAVSVVGAALSSAPAAAQPPPPPSAGALTTDEIVEIRSGKVAGYRRNGVTIFKGIPYAATTAGARRFLPPAPVTPWTGVRSSRAYGQVCPQSPRTGWANDSEAFMMRWDDGQPGEDCLRANVWTPGLDARRRPVMVWLHGGGFTAGSGQELPAYDGENLARKGDVVMVSVNHRLGPLGYLNLAAAGPAFQESANAGMLDLVAALRWVRDNIAAFGGDPGNVTIFGQSGGGSKVATLMAMPSASGLFHKAIVQSGSMKLSAANADSDRLMRLVLAEFGLTLSDAAKLQTVPADELIARANKAIRPPQPLGPPGPPGVGARPPGWSPSVDGRILPEIPFGKGAPAISAKIPMIIGSTRDEWAMAYNRDQPGMTEVQLVENVRTTFGAKTNDILTAFRSQYPGVPPAELLGLIMSAPLRNQVLDQVSAKHAQGAAPVYTYWFTWQTPVLGGMPKAFHCADLPHCFANAERCESTTGNTADARAVGDRMSTAWLNFAKTGNPSQSGLAWPAFEPSSVPTMIFDSRCRMENDPAGAARRTLL